MRTKKRFPGTATADYRLMGKTILKSECLGVRVRYDVAQRVLVDSRGMWWWKEIVVGPQFFNFPPREQQAILLHEVGHCKLNHVAKLAAYVLLNPMRLARFLSCGFRCAKAGRTDAEFFSELAKLMPELAAYRMAQELQADRFAAGCGYGPDLARAFGRMQSAGGPFHPHPALRVSRLIGAG